MDSKKCLLAELAPAFIAGIPAAVKLETRSQDRSDYILHPATGERLSDESLETVRKLRRDQAGNFDVQIVVSDGLNALSISDAGQLAPFLEQLRAALRGAGLRAAAENLVFTSGRVRAGYRVGEALFGGLAGKRTIVHVIGERPGTGHHTFSVYLTTAPGAAWGEKDKVDHNITKVVSGIATTALDPRTAADQTFKLLKALI
jgi:ethanolamine ammonia-lyase large subunit